MNNWTYNNITKIIKNTRRKIFVGGKEISKYKDNELTKYRAENIGFIFQFYNVLPTLTVLENVELISNIVKQPKNAKEVLKEVGLDNHYNKFPNQLSGGEQQRVSIDRAISQNPLLLLCDETTGALDSKTGTDVLKLLKKQKKKKKTVIIVTHNSLFAEVADRVIRLKNGKIESNTVNLTPKKIEEVKW